MGALSRIRGRPPTATSRLQTTPRWYISSPTMRWISRAASPRRSTTDHQPHRYGGMVASSSSTATWRADLSHVAPRPLSGTASSRATAPHPGSPGGPSGAKAAGPDAATATAAGPEPAATAACPEPAAVTGAAAARAADARTLLRPTGEIADSSGSSRVPVTLPPLMALSRPPAEGSGALRQLAKLAAGAAHPGAPGHEPTHWSEDTPSKRAFGR